jgi:hypothetical protein
MASMATRPPITTFARANCPGIVLPSAVLCADAGGREPAAICPLDQLGQWTILTGILVAFWPARQRFDNQEGFW